MGTYWIRFKDGSCGCVEAIDEESALVSARMVSGKEPVKLDILPYPASPRLVAKKYKDKKGREYHIPSFCYRPEQCKGNSCCPQKYSCTE